MSLKFYRLITCLAGPFIDLYLAFRRHIGKEDKKRFHERFGDPSVARPPGLLLWVHAASVGEVASVLPLLSALLEKYPQLSALITTGTVTSARLLENNLPPRTLHQYVPIDRLVAVRSFLQHWQPNIALWVESELWPNLIIETKKSGCTMIQVNARISENSEMKWQRARTLARKMLECFSLSLAQTSESETRLKDMGAKNVKYGGNLKYGAPPLPVDPQKTGELLKMIGERELWVAASTHEGEEKIAAQVHLKLRKEHGDILTIIIPRHPPRASEIAKQIEGMDPSIKIAIRSRGEKITKNTGIYIADTIGELGTFFRLASIVFMGGSLVNHGGQNPLEPARLDCAVICGPHTENFAEIYREMKQEGGAIEIFDTNTLAATVGRFLKDPDLCEQVSGKAYEVAEDKHGIVESYVKEIAPYFESYFASAGEKNESA